MRPAAACWCAGIVPIPSRTRVVILQHPREHRMPIGTGRMARLSLSNSELHLGLRFDTDRLAAILVDAALLYPGADARPPAEFAEVRPRSLVVLDGTWVEARKLLRHNPVLQALPRIGFVPSVASAYTIRRPPAPHCWSTIEAVAYVLGILEGDPERFAPLLVPFHRLVARQLAYGKMGLPHRRRVDHSPAEDPVVRDAGP
jgi:DTW domain-containing protein YfiP